MEKKRRVPATVSRYLRDLPRGRNPKFGISMELCTFGHGYKVSKRFPGHDRVIFTVYKISNVDKPD